MTGDKNLEGVLITVALTRQFFLEAVPKTQPRSKVVSGSQMYECHCPVTCIDKEQAGPLNMQLYPFPYVVSRWH